MKSKNNDTNKLTEKLLTFTSSIVTKARTIPASLRSYLKESRENRRDVFLAVVLLVSLFVVPLLLCITASAAELPSTPPTPPPDLVLPDNNMSLTFPTWSVETPAGTYSTASKNGVYAYFTSVNGNKASTRTTTYSAEEGLKTRVFAFKDVNNPNRAQLIRLCANVYCFPEPYALHPILSHTTLAISNDCTYNVSFGAYLGVKSDNPIFTTFTSQFTYDVDTTPTLPVSDIVQAVLLKLDNAGYSPDDVFITELALDFDVNSGFSATYPDESYIDVYVRKPSASSFKSYLENVTDLLTFSDLWDDYYYRLGLYDANENAEQAYANGYDAGKQDGINIGVASNFDPGWFVEGVDAVLNIRLFQYQVLGATYDFTLGTIFMISVGGTALLWFLKLFAGG